MYSTHHLAQANDAATNASNNISFDEPTNKNRQCVFPWRGGMVALPDVSALVAVERRPKEVSPVFSVIDIHEPTIFELVVNVTNIVVFV